MIFIPLRRWAPKMESYPSTNRKFNCFEISFGKGQKKRGDYVIYVNNKQVTDQDIFNYLATEIISQEDAINFLSLVWEIGKIDDQKDEEQVFNKLNASTYNAKVKTSLYVIWHRLIIDDINYPPPRLNGRKRLLGHIYILFAKKHNFNLPKEVKSIPDEVYFLGFPIGIEEKIGTESWPKIYELYKKFLINNEVL